MRLPQLPAMLYGDPRERGQSKQGNHRRVRRSLYFRSKDKRPELDCLTADARRRKLDAVLVVRFNRFARSVKNLVLALEEFNALGIDFISLNEPVGTSMPMGKM